MFAPALSERTGEPADPTLFEPTSNAAVYLQNAYTVPADGDFDAALAVRTAGDPSAWSAANARYQRFFADLTTRFGFEDSLLLDTNGNVVYTAYKGADLGTNLFTGPYKTSLLADGYREALQATSVDQTFVTDFERYPPSYDKPTPWVLSPIGSGGNIVGVLALQLSLDGINNVMTGDKGWEEDGLGETGETYLAGPDKLMRSVSRELLTNPDDFVDAGRRQRHAHRRRRTRSRRSTAASLLQPVDTLAVNRALAGESGVATDNDYIGPPSLVSYMPLDIPGLDWVLVAKIDENEALAPVNTFARNIALSTAAIVLVVCIVALLLSRLLTRPLTQLASAVRRVTSGEFGVTVPVTTKDEFGDLAAEFNDMSDSLRTKQELIDAQRKENDELLASLMPESVAQRYRDGETTISSDYRDVSVIYAELLNFKEFAESLSSEESVRLLNTLIEAFDAAAEHHGIERVRSLHNGFLATCGLVIPRVDHASRTAAFAIELVDIIELFNEQHDARLALRIGIDSGPVSSGLIGQRSRSTTCGARPSTSRTASMPPAIGPASSSATASTTASTAFHTFTEAGTCRGADGTEPVWALADSRAGDDVNSLTVAAMVLADGDRRRRATAGAADPHRGPPVAGASAAAAMRGRSCCCATAFCPHWRCSSWSISSTTPTSRRPGRGSPRPYSASWSFCSPCPAPTPRCSARRGQVVGASACPSIFIDLGRLIVIVIGLGLLFSWVWGTNIGGLFAAVGVTSIVIGLAVQTAVGPVIAGLFLLFEQPFRIGDWLDTAIGQRPRARGQLAIHPHRHRQRHPDRPECRRLPPPRSPTSAASTERPSYCAATVTFSADDRPGTVMKTLMAVADALPQKADGGGRPRDCRRWAASTRSRCPSPHRPTKERRRTFCCNGFGMPRAVPACTSTRPRRTRPRRRCGDIATHSQRIATALGLDADTVEEMMAAAAG